jgi:hypothetical protein
MIKEEQIHVHKWKGRSRLEEGRVFIPLWRMRRIKHETDVANAAIKRLGGKDNAEIRTYTCTCGSVNCLGDVYAVEKRKPESPQPTPRKRKSRTLTPRDLSYE